MKNFVNYFKKAKWTKGFVLLGIVLLISIPSYAGSIKEVNRSIKQVQSIEPPFRFAMMGDSRDGEKVADLRVKGSKMKLTTIPSAEWATVEAEAHKFWDEIAATSPRCAKVVKIFRD